MLLHPIAEEQQFACGPPARQIRRAFLSHDHHEKFAIPETVRTEEFLDLLLRASRCLPFETAPPPVCVCTISREFQTRKCRKKPNKQNKTHHHETLLPTLQQKLLLNLPKVIAAKQAMIRRQQ